VANAASKLTMKILTVVIGIPVGKATKRAIDKTWARTGGDESSRNPKHARARWTDAIGWAALSAAGVAVAQLATRKGAEQTYRAITGLQPPPPPPTKAEKKAAKAMAKAGAQTTIDA
jgi:hypothetical protein